MGLIRLLLGYDDPVEAFTYIPPRPQSGYVERPCIGCLRPFKKWGVTTMKLMEQFCSSRCERSFFKGYDLGLRVLCDVRSRSMGGGVGARREAK